MGIRSASRIFLLVLLAGVGGLLTPTVVRADDFECFKIETACDTGQPGYRLQVAVAADLTIHLVHHDAASSRVRHTTRVDDLWQTADVTGPLAVADLALALGPGDVPEMVYVDGATGDVVWLDPALGAASAVVLNPAGPAADGVKMAIDPAGDVRLIFHAGSAGEVWYVERTDGGWSSPTLVSAANALGDLALGTDGQAQVAVARGQDLVAILRQGGSWTEYPMATGVAGLGSSPAIFVNTANVTFLAFVKDYDVPRIFLTWNFTGLYQEMVGQVGPATDPVLSLSPSTGESDRVVTYWRDQDESYAQVIRNSFSPWEKRLFPADGGTIQEGASATHPLRGMVQAFRRDGRIEVYSQEVQPTVTAWFDPNPAVGGEAASLHVDSVCADELLLDGEELGSGTVFPRAIYSIIPDGPGPYVVTALNGYAAATDTADLEIAAFNQVTFDASPLVALGNPATLSWDIPGADQITIEPGGITSSEAQGTAVVYPDSATTYTLDAVNTGYGATSATATVSTQLFLNYSFFSSEGLILAGESATLSWSAVGADSVSIEPGGFTAAVPTGELVVQPTLTTTYTFTAVNEGYGQQSKDVTVEVEPLRIVSFTAEPEVVLAGDPVVLRWRVDGTAEVELEGFGPQAAVDTLVVQPVETTDYVLAASWEGFVRRDTVTVQASPGLGLQASYSATGIDRNPSGVTVGVPFDVYFHWVGPPAGAENLEFGIDLPVGGVVAFGDAVLVAGGQNWGSVTDWRILGNCFFVQPGTAFGRLTLLVTDPGALSGGQLSLRGIPGGDFPDGPGYVDCEGVPADLLAYEALPLDPGVVDVPGLLPSESRIETIFPNPFNPQTTVHFTVRGAGDARLEIYDLAGRRVRGFAVAGLAAGSHVVHWEGRDDAGGESASGVYLFRLVEGGDVHMRRAVLVR